MNFNKEQNFMSEIKLGKMHLWWLNKFIDHCGSMVVSGYENSPYGKALGSLIKHDFIKYDTSFDYGLARLEMTKKGYEAIGISMSILRRA